MIPTNPYITKKPIHGRYKFIGRQNVLNDIKQALNRQDSNITLLPGQRCTGKTSFLLHLEKHLMGGSQYTPIYFDFDQRASLPLEEVLYQLAQAIAFFTKMELPQRRHFEADIRFFWDVFIPKAVKSCKREGLVLLFDEFDQPDAPQSTRAGATFWPFVNEWMPDIRRLQCVCAFGRQPEERSPEFITTFENARAVPLSLMNREDTTALIQQSEKSGYLKWKRNAVEQIWRWTQGHPYFIQQVCFTLWDAWIQQKIESPVKEIDVEHVIEQMKDDQTEQLEWMWGGLDESEQAVAAAIACSKQGVMAPEEFLKQQGFTEFSLKEMQRLLDSMAQWGLLMPMVNGFRLAVPILAEWVKATSTQKPENVVQDTKVDSLAENLYQAGEGFYRIRNLELAVLQLQSALEVVSDHARAHLLLGQIMLEQDNMQEAVEHLDAAYQTDPEKARDDLIKALLSLAEQEQSEERQVELYERILNIDPEYTAAPQKKRTMLLNLAQQHEGRENWKIAAGIYKNLVQELLDQREESTKPLTPQMTEDLDGLYARALDAVQQEDSQTAQHLFGKVISIQPDYKDALHHLVLTAKGVDLNTLLRDYRKAQDEIKVLQYQLLEAQRVRPAAKETLDEADTSPIEGTEEFHFDVITLDERAQELEYYRGTGRQHVEDLGNGVKLDMIFIPAGNFLMGSPPNEAERFEHEGPQHEVELNAFWMGKHPVTQEQWMTIMDGQNPSEFQGAKRPVEKISWYDAVEFCRQISNRTGHVYRLPTEAEWEFACRAGTSTPFHFGATIITELVNYNGSTPYASAPKGRLRGSTTEVGIFLPNAFGLTDMHGNIWEWCQDWFDAYYYENSPVDNPRGPETGAYRVIRGGSWDSLARSCRSANRRFGAPGSHCNYLGFRLVRVV